MEMLKNEKSEKLQSTGDIIIKKNILMNILLHQFFVASGGNT